MFKDRIDNYKLLEARRDSKLLVYVTGDRPGLETQIHQEILDYFIYHLDIMNDCKKISLFLYTRGGNTLAAWSLVNLIRQFCDHFEVIIPLKAHSAGTLISIGADSILMTKQATLGPIDPSLNTPLNPQIPGLPPTTTIPVSVEAINGFIALAREELNIRGKNEFTSILNKLTDRIHPLVLGEVYRARDQIKMLASKLLSKQIKDKKKLKNIISFLCSESGSHDYTINRREARDELGLNIEKPDDSLYLLIKAIYDDIQNELQLTQKYDPRQVLGSNQQARYSFRRALIESISGGSDYFVSEGTLVQSTVQAQPNVVKIAIEDQRDYEGWKHENT